MGGKKLDNLFPWICTIEKLAKNKRYLKINSMDFLRVIRNNKLSKQCWTHVYTKGRWTFKTNSTIRVNCDSDDSTWKADHLGD